MYNYISLYVQKDFTCIENAWINEKKKEKENMSASKELIFGGKVHSMFPILRHPLVQ